LEFAISPAPLSRHMIPWPKPFTDSLSYRARPRSTPPNHKSREASVKTARPFWLTRVAVTALVLSFFSACEDTTEPTIQLDPESTADIVDELVADFLEGNDAAMSLEVFGDAIAMALGGGMPPLSAGPPAEAGPIPRHLLGNPVYRAAANIPEIFEGVTFVWDDQEEGYVPSELPGAPLNGVRFMLYAVNPSTGEPLTPVSENEIGYLEIADASSWPSINISMAAVVGDVTLISATITGNFGETSAWINIDGFLSDGTEQLLYNMYASEGPMAYTFEFGLEYGNFEASWSMTYSESGLEVEVAFTDGTNTIVFSLNLVEDTIVAGSGITINGETVAIIEGSLEGELTITNAEGDPLTAAELAALEQVFEAMGELSEWMEGMLQFVAQLAQMGEPIG
jgi:hypothetical protein